MTGKGWVWIASDGATTLTFDKQKDLETAMQGMLGIQPKRGEGSLFLRFRAAWMENAQPVYPGKVGNSLGTITLTLFVFFYGKGKHCMIVSSDGSEDVSAVNLIIDGTFIYFSGIGTQK